MLLSRYFVGNTIAAGQKCENFTAALCSGLVAMCAAQAGTLRQIRRAAYVSDSPSAFCKSRYNLPVSPAIGGASWPCIGSSWLNHGCPPVRKESPQ